MTVVSLPRRLRLPAGLSRIEAAALAAILAGAGFLGFFRLAREGYANRYYAAGVKSMGTSFSDFWFASFDSGGYVTIDKPPAGLWVQVISTKIFGFSGWSLLAPQAFAGVVCVFLIYYLVRRDWGPVAGITAAVALAVTPISVVASRNNTSDVVLVCILLLATWALLRASDKASTKWLLVAAALVGVGFNVKMAQAYLVVPALVAAYFVAAPNRWHLRIGQLVLAAAVMAAVSLSWAATVQLTPTDSRPFVGSTGDNNIFTLMLDHNGFARLLPGWRLFGGNSPGGNQPQDPPAGHQPAADGAAPVQQPASTAPQSGGPYPQGNRPAGQILPPIGQGPFVPVQQQPSIVQQQVPDGPQDAPRSGGGGLAGETGERGPLRLFNQQLAGQISWLLPLAVAGVVLGALSLRPKWPLAPRHRALVLWGVWLLTTAVFFSVANLFHRYYLVMMAPGIAALCGIAASTAWDRVRRGGPLGLVAIPGIAATVALELWILRDHPDWRDRLWLPTAALAALGCVAAVLAALPSRWRRVPAPVLGSGLALGLAGLAIAPATWALIPVWEGQANDGLPGAGPQGAGFGPGAQPQQLVQAPGQTQPDATQQPSQPQPAARPANAQQPNSAPISYLEAHRSGEKWLAASGSIQTAAGIILETGEPVMALGGFSGSDPILTADDLRQKVEAGEVRFFLVGSGGPGPDGPNRGDQPPALRPGHPPDNPQQPNQPAAAQPNPGPAAGPGGQGALTQWVSTSCTRVPRSDWAAGNAPAGQTGGDTLYDCRPGGSR